MIYYNLKNKRNEQLKRIASLIWTSLTFWDSLVILFAKVLGNGLFISLIPTHILSTEFMVIKEINTRQESSVLKSERYLISILHFQTHSHVSKRSAPTVGCLETRRKHSHLLCRTQHMPLPPDSSCNSTWVRSMILRTCKIKFYIIRLQRKQIQSYFCTFLSLIHGLQHKWNLTLNPFLPVTKGIQACKELPVS